MDTGLRYRVRILLFILRKMGYHQAMALNPEQNRLAIAREESGRHLGLPRLR